MELWRAWTLGRRQPRQVFWCWRGTRAGSNLQDGLAGLAAGSLRLTSELAYPLCRRLRWHTVGGRALPLNHGDSSWRPEAFRPGTGGPGASFVLNHFCLERRHYRALGWWACTPLPAGIHLMGHLYFCVSRTERFHHTCCFIGALFARPFTVGSSRTVGPVTGLNRLLRQADCCQAAGARTSTAPQPDSHGGPNRFKAIASAHDLAGTGLFSTRRWSGAHW